MSGDASGSGKPKGKLQLPAQAEGLADAWSRALAAQLVELLGRAPGRAGVLADTRVQATRAHSHALQHAALATARDMVHPQQADLADLSAGAQVALAHLEQAVARLERLATRTEHAAAAVHRAVAGADALLRGHDPAAAPEPLAPLRQLLWARASLAHLDDATLARRYLDTGTWLAGLLLHPDTLHFSAGDAGHWLDAASPCPAWLAHDPTFVPVLGPRHASEPGPGPGHFHDSGHG